ncbi:hypothetical protein [Shimia ponticola]|uniref:hypothetical protein n=1 Tax=Shimia ponticola TaxID=2582893 RepID=UPI0011BE4D33|nr:hypothetical protein [Shimia ponticola]
MADLLPCPLCGNDNPEVDRGLDPSDGLPFISCPTVHLDGPHQQRCPMNAQGVDAWNYIAKLSADLHAGKGRMP